MIMTYWLNIFPNFVVWKIVVRNLRPMKQRTIKSLVSNIPSINKRLWAIAGKGIRNNFAFVFNLPTCVKNLYANSVFYWASRFVGNQNENEP